MLIFLLSLDTVFPLDLHFHVFPLLQILQSLYCHIYQTYQQHCPHLWSSEEVYPCKHLLVAEMRPDITWHHLQNGHCITYIDSGCSYMFSNSAFVIFLIEPSLWKREVRTDVTGCVGSLFIETTSLVFDSVRNLHKTSSELIVIPLAFPCMMTGVFFFTSENVFRPDRVIAA